MAFSAGVDQAMAIRCVDEWFKNPPSAVDDELMLRVLMGDHAWILGAMSGEDQGEGEG